jgi:diguanylate cyclase (GGDEF)-like protein/PAS domain S-box-containing protein
MGDPRNTAPGGASRARLTCRWIAHALFGRRGGTSGPPRPDLQQQYRDVYENATEGIFRTSPDGRFLSANPAMVAMMGDADEAALLARLTGVDRQVYADPARRDELARLLQVEGAVEQFEAEVVRADGSRAWHSVSARVHHDEAGRPLHVDGTVRDVSDRKRVQAELLRTGADAKAAAAEARKLALVVSRTHNPVIVADARGRFEWANAAFLTLTGYALSELVGQESMSLLSGPRGDAATLQLVREKLAAGEPFEVELLRHAKDGRPLWLALDVEPLRDEGGLVRQFIAHLDDITDRKRAHSLDQDRRHLLERVARHEPVGSTLAAVCDAVERQWDGARAAVLRYDVDPARGDTCREPAGGSPPGAARWWTAAAPRLSAALVSAIDAALVDPTGPFAPDDAAAPTDVTVADVTADPRWSALAATAAAEGIVACRSTPIVSGGGALLGRLVVLLPGAGPADAAADEPFRRAVTSLAGLAALAVEHQRLTDQLARQAMHDPLTGLPNRARLDAILPGWLASAARAGRPLGVLMIDLDGFKHVNDTLGHAAGDALLVQVAGRLSAAARDGDVLVRMGGDEFALVATDLANARDAGVVAGRLIAALSAPFAVDGRELFVTASIGTAAYPDDGTDGVALVRNADTALYAAKAAGRNRSAKFDPSMNVAARERLDLEGRLRRVAAAIASGGMPDGELKLVYQPQVDGTGRIRGVEALLRWDDPRLGRLCPAKFVPVAEASGLIVPIGTWALREACRQAAAWRALGVRPMPVAVNVSVVQFAQPDFVDVVASALADHDLDARWLELELTESVLMANTADAVEKLTSVRLLGASTAIDDFGTGYSSLAYLRRLPIDQLKIDQSFIRDLATGGRAGADTAVLTAIAGLASNLGMETVAEGVETIAQRDYLMGLGCNVFQGFLYAKPMTADRVEPLLRAGRIEIAYPVNVAAA